MAGANEIRGANVIQHIESGFPTPQGPTTPSTSRPGIEGTAAGHLLRGLEARNYAAGNMGSLRARFAQAPSFAVTGVGSGTLSDFCERIGEHTESMPPEVAGQLFQRALETA